ncbi:MAG: type II toxin-antitoxin system RelE/ParE family toxin [Firmicutes bacterium]|nr:type II toxin-antitoxin system RelE/ParE family toxin [Bacillota bacterium]
MRYTVKFTERARNNLLKLDKSTSKLILAWIRKNLENCEDPRRHGKALTANLSGQWRYRVGNYRILAQIDDNEITILVLEIGHRRDIYK